MKDVFDVLSKMYLPGYMTLLGADYHSQQGGVEVVSFDFKPVEPPVTLLSDRYLTPRGVHVSLSQAMYYFIEKIVKSRGIMETEELRNAYFMGRLKIIEFNQKFRREVGLDRTLYGDIKLRRLRMGRMPVVKFGFDLERRAIIGEITGILSSVPRPQLNRDILRPQNLQ